MATLYINQNDCLLKKVDERLIVVRDKEKLMDVQLIKITQVVIFGRVTVTPEVFSELSIRNISLSYLSEYGKYKTRLEPPLSKNVLLRISQYKNNLNDELKSKLAKEFVKGKLMNYRMAILQLQRENKDIDISSSINLIKEMIKKADLATDPDKIRGYEGCGSAEYFKCFPKFIKNPDFKFLKRERHPPPDSVNALLSLGYSLLRIDIESAINIVGFDPYIGYLHCDRYGRASLALDLMEEFRPLVVDSCIIQMINRKQLTPEDFSEDFPGSVLLKDEARKTFFTCYTQRKQTEFRHPYFNYKVNYQRCFELQARILAKYLTGEIDEYIPLIMR
jgi:CRISPR-associated protein Cas1